MSKNVICWIELEDGLPSAASLELLGEASEVARAWGSDLAALVLTDVADNQAAWLAKLGQYGTQWVLVALHPLLATYEGDAYCAALTQILAQQAWTALLAPATANAADFVARLAARLEVAVVSDCVRLAATADGGLNLIRPVYSDRLHSHYHFVPVDAAKIIATFRPGARGLDLRPKPQQAALQIIKVNIEPTAVRTHSIAIVPPAPNTVDLVEAEKIVAVGLGLPHPLGVNLAYELAADLGAAVGGTRPIVDKGWLPFERQIGTTGRSVAPRLYVAMGISGASQHTGGIRGARTIIAINPDRSAPLMALADLAIVGDAAEIVPLLLKLLAAHHPKVVDDSFVETKQAVLIGAGSGHTSG